ncbi:Proto-oncogene Mas [Varanus komodoensis]|uniref:proto-oncogene Mas-like n=1 Tax=Varanus komodoensis TaxID=61221 RepID=UPI001CF7A7C1|nr:proto-oncogene Mas-like [Varanus komodoensis]KAF7237387.1 Proto-oncogene Mas [Varanus komodoensis]
MAALEQKLTLFSPSYSSPVSASLTNNGSIAENSTCGYVRKDHNINDGGIFSMIFITLFICLVGFVCNGMVIWLLGFRIKRTPINTYLLNLSIADFGVVTSVIAIDAYWLVAKLDYSQYRDPLKSIFRTLFLFMYSNSQFLLTVISIDRCVSVFFPLWYRCHRPPYLSTVVCAAIWILTFLLSPLHAILFLTIQYCDLWFHLFLLNGLVFTSIMCVSTITLFIKACLISSQHKRGKLLTSILLALLFFLLFAFPMNAIQYLSFRIPYFDNPYLYEYAYICASLNSAVNPVIYFLVGRQKNTQSRSMKVILEKVFTEEEEYREAPDFPVQTQV